MATLLFADEEPSNNTNKIKNPLQCVVLYHTQDKVPEALIQPFQDSDNPLVTFFEHPSISEKKIDHPVDDSCTLRFAVNRVATPDQQVEMVWSDVNGASAVLSRRCLLDIVRSMQKHGKSLIACCDLYTSKQTAGTLFFQKEDVDDEKEEKTESSSSPSVTPSMRTVVASNKASDQQTTSTSTSTDDDIPSSSSSSCEIACIGFDKYAKIRLIDFASDEEESLFSSKVILEKWKFGTIQHNIERFEGVKEFKLQNSPWWTMETTNERHLEARRLVIAIMEFMWNLGWTKVLPVDCSVIGTDNFEGDMDSLLFYRNPSISLPPPTAEFICLCLEQTHKLRLIGTNDGETHQIFNTAVSTTWKQGIYDSSIHEDSYQVKLKGHPWQHRSTQDSVQAATLMCNVIEALLTQGGWEWHCALDMTRSLQDKSTFFFRRVAGGSATANNNDVIVSCLQPKGRSKVNFCNFPQTLLVTLMQEMQEDKTGWVNPIIKDIRILDDTNSRSGAVEYESFIHDFYDNTEHLARNNSLYRKLLERILQEPGAKLLGCGDIWTCVTADELEWRDTDVFFISFPASADGDVVSAATALEHSIT